MQTVGFDEDLVSQQIVNVSKKIYNVNNMFFNSLSGKDFDVLNTQAFGTCNSKDAYIMWMQQSDSFFAVEGASYNVVVALASQGTRLSLQVASLSVIGDVVLHVTVSLMNWG